MNKTPILFIAFTRLEYIRQSILNILVNQDRKIYVSIDKADGQNENILKKNKILITEIKTTFKNNTTIHINRTHLGLRKNVEQSVSRTLKNHPTLIICEDDVVVDKKGLEIFDFLMQKYENNKQVAHISIYNRVPESFISKTNYDFRFSNIPETYIWGTWRSKWKKYDENILKNLDGVSIDIIKNKVGTWIGAITWKIHLWEAKVGIVDSWAYRWLASMWINDLISITTNKNYVYYFGNVSGTHTNSFLSKKQLNKEINFNFLFADQIAIDKKADSWTLKHDANGSILRFPLKLIQTLGSILKKFFKFAQKIKTQKIKID